MNKDYTYTIHYGDPFYHDYKGKTIKEIEKEFPVRGNWVYHIKKDGTIEKWMFLGLY